MWYCYNSVITLVHIFCGFVNLEKIDNNNNNNNGQHFSRILRHSAGYSVSLRIRSKCGKMREKCGPE